MEFEETMETVAEAFEVLGVAIIAVGCLIALLDGARQFRNAERFNKAEHFFKHARTSFGRPLILGLEILVAADIIETITVDRTLESAAALGILVLVRVVLSFSLDIEVEGMPPWRRARVEARLAADESAS
ncbi:MAG: DUF1622 domain-containing protein [Acidimicrobiales bacterium]